MIRSQENNMMYKYLYSIGNKLFILEVGKGVSSVFIRGSTNTEKEGKDDAHQINWNIKILMAKFIEK